MNKMEKKHILLLLKSVPHLISPKFDSKHSVAVSNKLNNCSKKAQPHGFLCVAKFYHLIDYTFMKDRFRSTVFFVKQESYQEFCLFSKWKREKFHVENASISLSC